MSKKPTRSIFYLPFDLIKAFLFTFKVLTAFMKEAREVTFSDTEEQSIDEQIKLKARKLLQTQVENYGSKVITPRVEDEVKEKLNQRFLDYANDPDNQPIKTKIDELLRNYLKGFDLKRLAKETGEQFELHLNAKFLEVSCQTDPSEHKAVAEKIESLLLELLTQIGQQDIFKETRLEIDRHLNQKILTLACATQNPVVTQKIEELTSGYIKGLTQVILTAETLESIRKMVNERGLGWTALAGMVEIEKKSQELFTHLIGSLQTQAVSAEVVEVIKATVSTAIQKIASLPENAEVLVRAKELSAQIIGQLTQAEVANTTQASIITHVNQELLKFACEQSNGIINNRLVGILQELVNGMGPHSLYPETENAIRLNLNTRAVDLAQIPNNPEMIQGAEELLHIFLQSSENKEVVEQGSLAAIKRTLNEVLVELIQETGKIEKEAKRVFNEILENCGPGNIDPLVRMKVESVLYQVLVKQLAVYGNKELTHKALELIQEVAQSLPHESSVNDLIMSHKVRQPSQV
ncbi:MAG: hypothetical protein A2600_08405 [Candidatus Lambdaproteobacteria bacterium RIFOXYD1_FULL_56_27]|uniref:Uncharacterized protein n=1 Tax=Candidatus Lambdaproteobacteria bacterium RIFOXYD2_FULL_56_26 TaxID=1817773 RepID=A0A1F6H072_9PROT|nr:MAG: hypothetical protein A2426_06675 [Candidatus Lambdaproteobacteria bacterium RIFOXYC1_FULL_56_13]OGH03807.1 MAG: hypothetical protein A2557_13735 [Candidatus Lambdaproteobacteria bacterium RIFOXYD2_FULL_56_26]OGH08801.1 MAG: hypothetical protein A2600_08405 [Candidatus Lambdaproteobacteria bacterium RIFOXYD1_FULL_56_27]